MVKTTAALVLGATLAAAQNNIEWKSCTYSDGSCNTESSCTQSVIEDTDCATYQSTSGYTMGCTGWFGISSQYLCTEFAQVVTTVSRMTYTAMSECTSGNAASTTTDTTSTLACEPAGQTGERYSQEWMYGMNEWNECFESSSSQVYKITCTDDSATADNPPKPLPDGCTPCMPNAGSSSDCSSKVSEAACQSVGTGTGDEQDCYYWGEDAYNQYYATGCPNYDANCVPCHGMTTDVNSNYVADVTCNAIYDEQACGQEGNCGWSGFMWGDNCSLSDAVEGFFEGIGMIILIIFIVFCLCVICVFCLCCGGAVMCGLAAAKKGESDGKASGQVSGV